MLKSHSRPAASPAAATAGADKDISRKSMLNPVAPKAERRAEEAPPPDAPWQAGRSRQDGSGLSGLNSTEQSEGKEEAVASELASELEELASKVEDGSVASTAHADISAPPFETG
jgi:hypothetical protein